MQLASGPIGQRLAKSSERLGGIGHQAGGNIDRNWPIDDHGPSPVCNRFLHEFVTIAVRTGYGHEHVARPTSERIAGDAARAHVGGARELGVRQRFAQADWLRGGKRR